MFMLASTSFWTVRAQGIVWGYYNLFNIARLPDEAFRGLFKAFFTFAIPMLLVANVPVKLTRSPCKQGELSKEGRAGGIKTQGRKHAYAPA